MIIATSPCMHAWLDPSALLVGWWLADEMRREWASEKRDPSQMLQPPPPPPLSGFQFRRPFFPPGFLLPSLLVLRVRALSLTLLRASDPDENEMRSRKAMRISRDSDRDGDDDAPHAIRSVLSFDSSVLSCLVYLNEDEESRYHPSMIRIPPH